MTFSTRPPTVEEHDAMQLVGDAPFMWTPGRPILDALRARFEPGRSVVAVDDDLHEIVGALKCYSMLVTVPGGRVLPVGELNEVGVLVSHRPRSWPVSTWLMTWCSRPVRTRLAATLTS